MPLFVVVEVVVVYFVNNLRHNAFIMKIGNTLIVMNSIVVRIKKTQKQLLIGNACNLHGKGTVTI